MKFQVNRDVFADAVSFAVKLLPQRTTLPILSGVLLRAEGDTLTLSSFDYEVSAQTAITADIEEDGTVLVSGLNYVYRALDDEAREPFEALVRDRVGPAAGRLGWEPRAGEDELTRQLRGDLLRALGVLGDDSEAHWDGDSWEAGRA